MTTEEGLLYFPSHYDPPLGHAGFEIRLTDKPGPRYFDAHRAMFPVEQAGVLRRLTVEHPYQLASEITFTSGRIRLEAHDGDVEEIVTFGGRVAVAVEGDTTVCRISSSAPFFPLDDNVESPWVYLESELEIVMAQSRAGWGRDEFSHLDRLGQLEPMALLVASMVTLQGRLEGLALAEGDTGTRRALHLVRDIRRTLERAGEWPATAVGLADLL